MSHRYSVLSAVIDSDTLESVPVGVALWSSDRSWRRLRTIDAGDKIRKLRSAKSMMLLERTSRRLSGWIAEGRLPGARQDLTPQADEWWLTASKLLVHSVRLSEPQAIDVSEDPDTNLEMLFESIVGPHRQRQEQHERIDRALARCLGDELASVFERADLDGFGGREVRVTKAYKGRRGWVVLEGVNLAGQDAEREMDATTCRLQRLRRGKQAGEIEIILGYIASPHGLNGERSLVEFAREMTGANVFDVRNDGVGLRDAARRSLDRAEGRTRLAPDGDH